MSAVCRPWIAEERPITVGDIVRIDMRDGAWFSGVLQEIDTAWVTINGCGFPLADIVRAERA